jgi:hypothetical protein
MWLFMSQPSVGRGRGALCQRTSISSIPLCRLGDGEIMEKLAAWAEAGADDAMPAPARREKAIFGFLTGKNNKNTTTTTTTNLRGTNSYRTPTSAM